MNARGVFAALSCAALLSLPMGASAAIVQKWLTTSGLNYRLISKAGDFNGDGVFKLITGETASGGTVKIGIRSGATGALLAQTALAYTVNGTWVQDIDADGSAEIFIRDPSGRFICLHYTTGNSTLAVRWTYTVAPQFEWAFVDFDGHGRPCIAFKDLTTNNYFVINYSGIQIATFTIASGPTGIGWSTGLYASDYDSDGHEELLIDYHYGNATGSSDVLYMYDANAPTAVKPGATDANSVALGRSYPNPSFTLSRVEYSTPTTGPASLKLFDVSGREVRTLVDGQVPAGRHESTWDGRDAQGREVPAGAYFYELNAGGHRQTRRVVHLH